MTDLAAGACAGVGMVFQNYALYPHLTVLQNILFPLENLKGDKTAFPAGDASPGPGSREAGAD